MKKDAKEWTQEQERLNKVVNELEARIIELEPEVTGLHDQVTGIRRRFWEEVTVNTNTHEDFEETFYSIRQQEVLLSERERSHKLRLQQLRNMKRLLGSPYFGRIDFEEKGMSLTEKIYIGVSSLVDTEGMNFLVYDWRTPIASLYYDHEPGEAGYDTPVGHIAGAMTLKRQYQIQGGQLQNVFDTSLTIGDELLQQVLGQGADHQMRSIIATIQKEQNAIIRDDNSKMLIVQGAAGSGKTSAALQRAAYLLYKHRERLTADQIVLFSPNPMFNSYVSTVLPELGEENMQQVTFQEYLEYSLCDTFSLEDPFDQMEYVLAAQQSNEEEYSARLSGIKYKASEGFLRAIQNYADWLMEEGMQFKSIRFRDRDLFTAEQIKSKFYSYDASIRLANRITLLKEWMLSELRIVEKKEHTASWVRDELDYLDKDLYAEVYSELHNERAVFDFAEQYEEVRERINNRRRADEGDFDYADREEELLRAMVVRKHFTPVKQSVKRLSFIDLIQIYSSLFEEESVFKQRTDEAEVPSLWPQICQQTQDKLGKLELFYEDATPYLYLKELIEGVRINTDVRHVFVDEGQDYSMFQYEYLKKMFPRARMTILGDFSQAIYTQATELYGVDSPLIRLYGAADTSLFHLVRSYRSTSEIVAFTKALLPEAKEVIPFNRSGKKPELYKIENNERRMIRMAEHLAELREEGLTSIGIITKTAAESKEAYELLNASGCQGVKLVTKSTLTFEAGVSVIPVYLAKGVEFDAVLIYDASADLYHQESERKLFYTACTRAMHRLLLYSGGEWTPFIPSLNEDLYVTKQ
ncbi:RNA polymerase recycling motor HelD [Paenibacillus sp. 453mf]|uniref:RNA polymerase recycling motor HelD n=1 Tax=Paenibacillus sp. 453mf TaxID=1761874 RepID=UPI0008E0D21D|nr:RNA polymerase recycling motor HelD [Paenibacillus sp. 453mf]SFS56331.1 DNA helicase-2 / ATP-dependent DNA helicase PcrA [Paenibacillus sp. 453mf]